MSKEIKTAEQILRRVTDNFSLKKKYNTEMVRNAMIEYAQQFVGFPNNAVQSELTQLRLDNKQMGKDVIDALKIIRQWHGMGMTSDMQEERMWNIYSENAPEMKKFKPYLIK